MEIVDLPHLPPTLRLQLAALPILDGEPPQDLAFLRRAHAFGLGFTPYHALYAIEGGTIHSRIDVVRFPFTTFEGPETVTGIAEVGTRPDSLRRGFAERLLRDVHRREVRRGVRWALLWTRRSWGAHRLYERLGYRDVYSPPSALRPGRPTSMRPLPRGYRWALARRADVTTLERLFRRSTRGRLGFTHPLRGALRARIAFGWRALENHHILYYRGEPVGYAHLVPAPWHTAVNEVVLVSPVHRTAMLVALERSARGRLLWLTGTSFVTDAATLLARRGFAIYSMGHLTLMAKSLVETNGDGNGLGRVCHDARFTCQRRDSF